MLFAVIKRLLIPALLALSITAPAHDWVWLPPQPAAGVNPCDHIGNSCPSGLDYIYEHLAAVQQRQRAVQRPAHKQHDFYEKQAALQQHMDTVHMRYWTDRLSSWYAFNPDYRPHFHPHR